MGWNYAKGRLSHNQQKITSSRKRLFFGPLLGLFYFSSHLLPIPKVLTITFETLCINEQSFQAPSGTRRDEASYNRASDTKYMAARYRLPESTHQEPKTHQQQNLMFHRVWFRLDNYANCSRGTWAFNRVAFCDVLYCFCLFWYIIYSKIRLFVVIYFKRGDWWNFGHFGQK